MRDTATVIHRNSQGSADYVVLLTLDFQEESGDWVGVCLELGTAAEAGDLGQAMEQLRESVELQLNEMERLCHVEDYLADNHVQVVPIVPAGCPEEAGFAVAMTGK